MRYSLTIRHDQFQMLREHLLPSDGNEAIVLGTCGTHTFEDSRRFFLNTIDFIPYGECSVRTPTLVTWDTSRIINLLDARARRYKWCAFKIHSHRATEYDDFSELDDRSDRSTHQSICNFVGHPTTLLSAIVLPDGTMRIRVIDDNGEFCNVDQVAVVGQNLSFSKGKLHRVVNRTLNKERQIFGAGTTDLLGRLKIGVVGCSGTGSVVIEQLVRLGVGALVLVDCDIVEERNLNRIINSTKLDARDTIPKVKMFKRAIEKIGIGTQVSALKNDVMDEASINALADCDVVFGCMDSIYGRAILNRISTYYCIPYFDVGILIQADGNGGVKKICGTSCYVILGWSSLESRGVMSAEEVSNSLLQKLNPSSYNSQLEEGYIKDAVAADVVNPAVISVNMLAASLCINDLLGRIHPYREDENNKFGTIRFELVNNHFVRQEESYVVDGYSNGLSYGRTKPLLGIQLR